MPETIDRPATMSEQLEVAVLTGSDRELPISPTQKSQFRDGWQSVINNTLENWLRDPSQLSDDGVDAPTGGTIRQALDVAEQLRDWEIAPPDSVVLDPNGGIVFETRAGQNSEVVHIWADGTVEYMEFDGAKLVWRLSL